MEEVAKLVIVFLLIGLVFIISVSSKRQIKWDWQYSQQPAEFSETRASTESQNVGMETSSEVPLSTYQESSAQETYTQSVPRSAEEIKTTTTGTKVLETETEEATGILLVPLATTTQSDTTSLENLGLTAEDIYNELKVVEQAARSYISGGFKISTLNSDSIYSKGYMEKHLAERYEVGYKVSGEGYMIFIKPKYEIPAVVLEEISKQPKVRLDGTAVVYEFWIRAYR
ncbi:hypothetical protein [Fervidobacterium changbaicum]|uniref:Uncharacterized protein n=1 Tax=Fervidobacterium changbaicum TaxID=310769 RepID=A0AAE6CE06_9BACT|nr:hypothetical protein [Fervidobacterium changbaicum]QAV33416.1 hypothetical protein CBS1_06590 [Fervidobacterium changbaicum]